MVAVKTWLFLQASCEAVQCSSIIVKKGKYGPTEKEKKSMTVFACMCVRGMCSELEAECCARPLATYDCAARKIVKVGVKDFPAVRATVLIVVTATFLLL